MSEFGRAFASAKRAGKKYFKWKGKLIAVRLGSDDEGIAGLENKVTNEKERHYIAEAIKIAENDPRGFGVRSKKVHSKEEAQRLLDDSVVKNLGRWVKSGKKGKFVDFMWKRWAPIGAENDPKHLNENWGKNVRGALRRILGEKKYKEWKRRNLVLSPVARAIKNKIRRV